MNCSPTITAEEFKTIHNGLYDLRSAIERLEGVIATELYSKLAKAENQITTALAGAYDQDDQAFDKNRDHYEAVKLDLGVNAIWSMFEVPNLNDPHPYENVDQVVYKDHFGKKAVSCKINGNTWVALYVAANACIRDSGDTHHIFIEDFTPAPTPGTGVLYLSTGS